MGKRVFISADIEGVTGVVHFDETERHKDDFTLFRKLMTGEVNAAIEGAIEGGADDIVVRDAHGDARNILPEELHKQARLIRGWADSPLGMMEGIDEHFDAAMFVGYHAAADTPDATLKHTMSLRISDVRINDIPMAEAGLNALIAGMFNVPLIFIAGDKAVCEYSRHIFGPLETVAVKEGMGSAAINLHPESSRELIRLHAAEAMRRLNTFRPFHVEPPYDFMVRYRHEHLAYKAQFYPGVKRVDNTVVLFTAQDLKDCFTFFYYCAG
ncbi:M55 family metallopeptidase [bacterium]|nr:M55 family metallopeptidase [candidate division CSSED10-310 bacterium]